MPFSIRPYSRFPVQCSVTYNAGPFFKLPLAYFSGFWILITLLVLSSGSGYAEWVSIGSSGSGGGYTVYINPDTINPDTIRRKGDLVKMWILLDYKTIQTVVGTSHLSVRSQHQYDCAEDRHRRLAYTFFSGNMESGKGVYSNPDEGKWEPVASDSVAEGLWKIACDKKEGISQPQ